jgi:hypothetical protein
MKTRSRVLNELAVNPAARNPHRDNPADEASASVVKVPDGQRPRCRRYPDMPWEPKAAFDAVAERFGR